MSVRMRHTRAHTANRRSHHALQAPRLSKCGNCGVLHRRHMVCMGCGQYRGKMVLDVAGTLAKRMKRTQAHAARSDATKAAA